MTGKQWRWMAIALGVIAIVAIGATIYFAWPRSASAGQVPTMSPTISPTSVMEMPTEELCCQTTFVDLETAPEGVWSNASALLLSEGWCAVIQRDQSWQQVRDETELRKTWEQGATEDFLLLCNPGPGSRFYSLEDSYGGRPGGHEGFWNDQAKKVWAFPDPTAACQPGGIIVLYENDDSNPGWVFEISIE